MALYRPEEIKKFIDKKIEKDSAALVNDKSIDNGSLLNYVDELRIFRKYADELMEDIYEDARRYEESVAQYSEAQAAKESEDEAEK